LLAADTPDVVHDDGDAAPSGGAPLGDEPVSGVVRAVSDDERRDTFGADGLDPGEIDLDFDLGDWQTAEAPADLDVGDDSHD
jgi:hypothetical protein